MNDGIGMTPVLQEPRRKATKKSKKIYFLSTDPANPHEYSESDRIGEGFVGNGTKSSPLIPTASVVEFCNAVNGKLNIYGDSDDSSYVMGFFEILKTSDSVIVPHEVLIYYGGERYTTISLIEIEATYYASLVNSRSGAISYLNPYIISFEQHVDRYIAGLNGAKPTAQSLYDFIVNDPQLLKQIDSSNAASVSEYPLLELGETLELNGENIPILTVPIGIDDFAGSGFTKDQFVRKVNSFPAT